MWMIAANFRRTRSQSASEVTTLRRNTNLFIISIIIIIIIIISRLAWSEGWRPPGAQSAFIR